MLSISGNWDLPVGPFASQVNADTGDDRGLVLQAEGGEVQTARAACHGGRKKDNKERAQNDQLQKRWNAMLNI